MATRRGALRFTTRSSGLPHFETGESGKLGYPLFT